MIKDFLFGISSALAESTGAAAAGTAAEGAAEEMAISPVAAILQMVLPLVLMGAVFYFMLIRPQRKKDKQVKEMLNNLKHGDRSPPSAVFTAPSPASRTTPSPWPWARRAALPWK